MRLRTTLFTLWVAAGLALGVVLMLRHAVALPATTDGDPRLAAGLRALRRDGDAGRWQAVHVLYAACRCSQRIIDHLVTTPRPEGVAETVVMVGATPLGDDLRRAGYAVRTLTPAALAAELGVEGAPLFVVADPEGRVRYAGGYTATKQGADIRDLAILAELRGGATPRPLALLGCAVSERLKAWLRPLELP